MRVLLTGGNGYIARSLYFTLHNKYSITSITRQDFDLTCWKATYEFFRNKSFDVIIHTAVAGGHRLKEDDDSVIRQNLLMYRNLLNHQDKFSRFISFGSGAELGNPTSPYGISKQAIAHHMALKPGFLNLRVFAVFDENELPTRFIRSNITRYINHEDMVVHQDRYMDFFYMADLVTLVDYFLSKSEWSCGEIDCVYAEKHKLTEIARMINRISKYRVSVDVSEIAEGDSYIGSKQELPIKLIGLEQGIKNIYNILR